MKHVKHDFTKLASSQTSDHPKKLVLYSFLVEKISSRQSGDFWIFSDLLDVFLHPRFIHFRMESPHLKRRNFELTRESFLTKDVFFPKHLIMPKRWSI